MRNISKILKYSTACIFIFAFSCTTPGNSVTKTETVYVDNTPDYTNNLVYNGCYEDGVDGLNGSSGLAVSPDNKNVYIIGNIDDSIVVFDRDTSTCALTYSTYFKNNESGVKGLVTARDIEVSPDNKNIYVTGRYSNALAVFLLIKEYE